MYYPTLSDPEFARYDLAARRFRAEAIAAASYQAVHALDRGLHATVRAVVGLAKRWQAWRDRRHAIAALRALDDRLLRDIGMHRSEIRAVVSATQEAERRGAERRGHAVVRPVPLRAAPARRTPLRPAINDNPTPDLARAACG